MEKRRMYSIIIGENRGYCSPEKVEAKKREILKAWKEDDRPRTLKEICLTTKVPWRNRSSVFRLVEAMVKDCELIKEGERRGATYRRNLSRLMVLDQTNFFQNKIKSSKESFQTFHAGDVDVSFLGLPKDDLTPYEQQCTEVLLDMIIDAWFFLYKLKTTILARQTIGREIKDSWISHQLLLRESSLFNEYIESNDSDSEQLKTFQRQAFQERDNLGFMATISLKHSKEFWQDIENSIVYFFEQVSGMAARYDLSKSQELTELVYLVTRSCLSSSVGAFYLDYLPIRELTIEEKVRIRDLKPLLQRYGEEGIEIILETFDSLKGDTFKDTGFVVKEEKVKEKLGEVLKKKEIFEKYLSQSFTGSENAE